MNTGASSAKKHAVPTAAAASCRRNDARSRSFPVFLNARRPYSASIARMFAALILNGSNIVIPSVAAMTDLGMVPGLTALRRHTVLDVIIVGLPAAALGPLGDLTESLLKRSFDTKDSGGILPGHGGFLDRVDGVYFVAPWTLFYILALRPLIIGPLGVAP